MLNGNQQVLKLLSISASVERHEAGIFALKNKLRLLLWFARQLESTLPELEPLYATNIYINSHFSAFFLKTEAGANVGNCTESFLWN